MPILNVKKEWNRFFLIILLCFASLTGIYAQTAPVASSFHGTITGMVIDSITRATLSRVTVIMREAGRIEPVQSTITNENGSFEVTGVYKKKYQLTFSSIGYNATTIQLSSFHVPSVHVETIVLAPLISQLMDIQVVAQKSIIVQDVDKLTYNVEADPESKTASAFDLLAKVPMVSFDAEDNLQLNGNGDFRLYINGKSSSFFLHNQSEVLKYFSASAIKTIEIMTVPPSKYEAPGVGGIINIITYKEMTSGYNGGVTVRMSSPKGLSTNGNVTAKLRKISLSGNFGFNTSTNPPTSSTFFRRDKTRQNTLVQTGSGNSHNASQNGSGEISYELNSMNLLTIGYSTLKGHSTNNFTQNANHFDAAGGTSETYRRLSRGKSNQYGNDVNLDYQHRFPRNEAQQLTLSYKLSQSNNQSTTDFSQQPQTNQKGSANKTGNDDDLWEQTFRADYVQPMKQQKLELGVSSVLQKNISNYMYKNQDSLTGILAVDATQSNGFHYKENIYSAYASLFLQLGKWSLKFGARVERAKLNVHLVSSSAYSVRDYANLVPTVTLSHKLKGFGIMRLSFTQRINRPDMHYLNPYVDLTDPLNIGYGNPDLQPALANVFNLSYSTSVKKTFLNIALFHQFTNNAIQQFTALGTDSIARTTFGNIGKSRNTNLSLGGNTTVFTRVNLNLNGNANYIQYTSQKGDKSYQNQGFTYNLSGSAAFRAKSWRVSSNATYNAPQVLLQGKSAGYFSNSISLNKQFLQHQKATLTIAVNSPFQVSRRSLTEVDHPSFHLTRRSYSTVRSFSVAMNYHFGTIQGTAHIK
jgi:outer membrane receptor protein involved in Fe transport